MSTHALWWLALGLGAVVAVVAVLLLQTFYRQVRRIERGSDAIWETGKQVARNTVTTWMLHQTTVRLDGLTDEALRHDAFLDSLSPNGSDADGPAAAGGGSDGPDGDASAATAGDGGGATADASATATVEAEASSAEAESATGEEEG